MIPSVPRTLFIRLSWTAVSYGIVQFIRLVNNVILSHLLAPALLGLMLIVNTIRTGIELFSDIGINQSIVSNPDGSKPDFYDTAWTLQFVRGLLLGGVCFLFSDAFARIFEQPLLRQILPIAALYLTFTGAESTSKSLLQKRMNVARLSTFEMSVAGVSLVAHITLALITPTIWALALGSLFSGAAAMIGSYLLIPGLRHRFILDRASIRDLLVFGKWVFFSSIIYFLAMSFDRLYFAKQIPLAQLGIYGIARALADMLALLALRLAQFVLFPQVASLSMPTPELWLHLRHGRRLLLLATAVGLGWFVAWSDLVVKLLYDPRYHDAGTILPLLLLGVWFAILSAVNEAILMGIRRPAYPAIANAMKLAVYLGGVPLVYHYLGFTAAVLVLSAGEAAKYLALWAVGRRQNLGFARDDFALTLVFVVAAILFRELSAFVGLTGNLLSLFPTLLPLADVL
jgi:O-antigen/teichoic acid export membrane protein